MATRVMHLNDYPSEIQERILNNFFSKSEAKTKEPNKIYVTVEKEIKNTGTSDPTITIASTGVLALTEVLEY